MLFHFKNKLNHFTLTNILSFDVKIIETKKEDTKIMTLKKCNYCKPIPL